MKRDSQFLEGMDSLMANKYAEDFRAKCYHASCEMVDQTEQLAIIFACELFHTEGRKRPVKYIC